MPKIAGYVQIVDPDRPLEEFDLVGCCHCSAQIRIKPGTASTVYVIFDPAAWCWRDVPGASCFRCLRPVCLSCYEKGTCLPLEQMLEYAERRVGG